MTAGMNPYYTGRMDEKDAALSDRRARGGKPQRQADATREVGPREQEPRTGYDSELVEALDVLDRAPPAYTSGSVTDAMEWLRRRRE